MAESCGTCIERAVTAFTVCEKHESLYDAAPALLEALEMLLLNSELGEYESQRQGKPRMIEARSKARAAIAQAKGATQ